MDFLREKYELTEQDAEDVLKFMSRKKRYENGVYVECGYLDLLSQEKARENSHGTSRS